MASSQRLDTFGARSTLEVDGQRYQIARLDALEKRGFNLARLPYSLKILLENLLRREDGSVVSAKEIEALARWDAKAQPADEIQFMPARVILQDFTGVPAIVDLAAMRDAIVKLGGNAKRINPLQPVELVIDHSVQIDYFGTPDAFQKNVDLEFDRNLERYQFLRWGQTAFDDFKVVPPGTGIVHQVNLEYLGRVVSTRGSGASLEAYPDTLVGTDSHTTMINGLGILGWGVGGIEAEAAMLGQPVSMLVPQVVGFELTGKLAEGATATDLVLTVTQMLRKKGVVGKFVEFFGAGLSALSLADRATVANMAPEYGATCGIFPVDQETLNYLRFSGRPEAQVKRVEAYMKAQGLFRTDATPAPEFSDVLALDLGSVEPSLAGPRRPQDRVRLGEVKSSFQKELPALKDAALKAKAKARPASPAYQVKKVGDGVEVTTGGTTYTLQDGSVVITAITSCTNTSNPAVLLAAGLVAQKAVAKGLRVKPWVKTSLAPGSQVVTEYLKAAGVLPHLEQLGFHVAGYGCTTCIGNSGPLPEAVSAAIEVGQLVAVSALSGNRNFEGRVHAEVRANYLASPPLVVAYALAGRIDLDLKTEPIGTGKDGQPVLLKDIWPSNDEVKDAIQRSVKSKMYVERYADVYAGPERWRTMKVPSGETYQWDAQSTYVRHPPYFEGMGKEPGAVGDITGARALAIFGDSITTDHISPAGSIKADSPAGKYLVAHGVDPKDFNQYGARRGNHEVMVRGTFANTRIKNKMVPGVEGGVTVHVPSGQQLSIYDAAMKYAAEGTPLIVLAGKEYGSGSSRDWAAKGPALQGVRAVIAESFERIHRSNLVGMGIVPLEFSAGETAESLGLEGTEIFAIEGLAKGIETGFSGGRQLTVRAKKGSGAEKTFQARVRIDTPQEVQYYRHGGILQYVLRQLVK
ncbi:MAG: aconitate hydratase AcnA [Deltaproteobacteria bacterium]|nr:aconitate hydratase AcnA [Deltaproteobacteria bacterium]